jgi:NADH-quinone oxidoreductase subunit N
VIYAVIEHTGKEKVEGFRGLAQTNPGLAGAMMLALFSLAGIPPLAGFVGKVFLFTVAAGQGYYWLVGVAAVNSTISLYYYLRIVREMYIEKPIAGDTPVRASRAVAVLAGVTAFASLVLGIASPVYETIRAQMTAWFVG